VQSAGANGVLSSLKDLAYGTANLGACSAIDDCERNGKLVTATRDNLDPLFERGSVDGSEEDGPESSDLESAFPDPPHARQFVRARYIRKTPNRGGSILALYEMESPRPRYLRVSAGSITPSSQSRAVE